MGGGQEINTGEAGLSEWFNALKRSFSHWDVYVSNEITYDEYTRGCSFADLVAGLNVKIEQHLHLATSIRSFRNENVSAFVKAVLDNYTALASEILASLDKYPIVLTRDLAVAKAWVRRKARGSERYGLLASSGALRLKAEGIFAKNEISAANYFLNGKDDVRSSFFLEDCASEFAVQGLELDYCIVAWDADFRYKGCAGFTYNNFSGTKWQKIRNETNKRYLKNAYRVLLTRARQGMVIFIPRGDANDKTRLPEFYDEIYKYLRQIGVREI